MELLPSRDVFRKNSGSQETILVFKKVQKHLGSRTKKAVYSRRESNLKYQDGTDWNFHSAETQPHLHALHPYPARFIPQIPRRAIEEWSKKGEVILDPFCGCGTTLLESILLERPAIGVDNNRVAHLISQAKTTPYTHDDLRELQRFISDIPLCMLSLTTEAQANVWIPDFKNLNAWFDESAILELGRLKTLIGELTARPKNLGTCGIFIDCCSCLLSGQRYPVRPGQSPLSTRQCGKIIHHQTNGCNLSNEGNH